MNKMKGFECAGCIISTRRNNGDLQYLIVKSVENHRLYSFPKGQQFRWEAPRTTATREVLEETGISVDINCRDGFKHLNTYLFAVFLKDIPTVTLQLKEVMEYRWVTRSELEAMPERQLNSSLKAFRNGYLHYEDEVY